MHILIGLGNPGKEYENTRHNSGRMALESFAKKAGFLGWRNDKKNYSLKTEGKIGKEKITCVLPETFMNKSGKAVGGLKAKNIIVLHDDIDLALGKFKISFGRGSGGHKGIESIIRALKTKDFIRIRIGISPKIKPPARQIPDFLLKNFSPKELTVLKRVFKTVSLVLESVVSEGLQKTMNEHN